LPGRWLDDPINHDSGFRGTGHHQTRTEYDQGTDASGAPGAATKIA